MMFKKLNISPIILLLLFLSQIYAQTEEMIFDCLDTDDGLSNSVITSIYKDSQGFMWFGTQDGLNKFDGYEFTVYKSIPFDTTSLSANWIQAIIEDGENNLWIGTHSNGLFRFDRGSKNFVNFKNDPKDENSISSNTIWTLEVSDSGKLMVGTARGLSILKSAEGDFENIYFEEDGRKFAVNAILKDKPGEYWIGTWGAGLFKFDSKSILSQFKFHEGDTEDFRQNKIKSMLNHQGEIFIATDGGLVKFNTITKKYRSDFLGVDKPSLSLLLFNKNKLWIGTHHDGLIIADLSLNTIRRVKSSVKREETICDSWIQQFYKDETGIVWIATGKGVSRYIPNMNNFKFITYDGEKNIGLSSGEINDVSVDSKGIVWISTWNGGLNKYDYSKDKFTHYFHKKNDKNSLPNDIVWLTYEDSENRLWVGTYSGLSRFDRETGKFITYKNDPANPYSLSHNNVSAIHQDASGNLWIGTWGGGLNKCSPVTGEFFSHRNGDHGFSKLGKSIITVINSDSSNIYIGTKGNGFNIYNLKTKSLKSFKNDPDNLSSLSNDNVQSIYIDQSDNVWIGTWGGGLNKFDKINETFTSITEEDGLANNVINSIIEDDNNKLWLSTNEGLSRLSLDDTTIINYDKSDGLGNNQFISSARLEDGTLLLGGLKGLTYFHPKNIKVNKNPPEIVFTSFKIFNKELDRDIDLNKVEEIILNYDESAMSVEFAALDYTRPQKNRYAYMLEGFHEDWIYSGSVRTAHFMNLSPGEYVLKVKASNNDNVWNEAGTQLAIVIVPPFWQTWTFRIIAALLLISAILFTYFWRINRIEIQKTNLEKQVDLKTKELRGEIEIRQKTEIALRQSETALKELNANKDKFFSIISHDLKSPFSSLLGFSEFLASDYDTLSETERRESILTMNENAKKVYSLTENLLKWSRLQTGKIELKPEKIELYSLTANLVNLLQVNAKPKNIRIINNLTNPLFAYADPDMISSVLRNLIINAIKFSFNDSVIKIESEAEGKNIKIKVVDEGIGITERDMKKLFRIEYHHTTSGTKNEKGTGLGLILCKELVEKNNGEIYVESEIGTGTTFMFTLPKSNGEVTGD